MGKIKDGIAAQTKQPVAGTQVSSIPKPKTPVESKPTTIATVEPKKTLADKMRAPTTEKTAGNASQTTSDTNKATGTTKSVKETAKANNGISTPKKAGTLEEYNQLAEQKRLEREVKVKDTITKQNATIINSSATGADIVNGINNGDVSSETLNQLAQTNPTLYEQYQQALDENGNLNVLQLISGVTDGLTRHAEAISNKFLESFEKLGDDRVSSKELYEKYANSEEVQELGKEVTTVEDEIEQLQITYDGIEDDVRAEIGTNASESYIAATTAKRQKELIPQFRRLESQYRKAKLDYNSAYQNGQVEFQFAMEDARYEDQRQAELLQTKYNMSMQTFQMQKEAVNKGLDVAVQDYFNNKSFAQQAQLMTMQTETSKDMIEREYQFQKRNGLLDKEVTPVAVKNLDGSTSFVNPFTGEIYSHFNSGGGGYSEVSPSGVIVTKKFADRTVKLDETAMGAFEVASSMFKDQFGVDIATTDSHRSEEQQYFLYGSGRTEAQLVEAGIPAEYANPDGPIKTWTTESHHQSGMAVDVWNVEQQIPLGYKTARAYINAVKPYLEAAGYVQPLPDKDPGHFEYRGDFKGYAETLAEDIMNPNSSMQFSDLTDEEQKIVNPWLSQMRNEAAAAGDPLGFMQASAGRGGEISQDFKNSLSKAFTVISNLSNVYDLMDEKKVIDAEGNKFDISPLKGWLAEKNPRDKDAQSMKAVLAATVPNLARGIYGEVGVLTDNDYKIYTQTIPNLRQTEDVKLAVLGLTLRAVKNSIDEKIMIEAGVTDISSLSPNYTRIVTQIEQIEQQLQGQQETSSTQFNPASILNKSLGITGYETNGGLNFHQFMFSNNYN